LYLEASADAPSSTLNQTIKIDIEALNRSNQNIVLESIMKWDGKIKNGSICYSLISGEDLAPTILDATNSPIPDEMTGKSITKTFTNPEIEIRNVAYAVRTSHGSGLPKSTANFDLLRTVFTKEYKLIYNVLWQLPYTPVDFSNRPVWLDLKERNKAGTIDFQKNEKGEFRNELPAKAPTNFSQLFFSATRPMFELYDLKNDPNELNNLAGKTEYAIIEHKYKALLHEWMIRYNDYCPLPIEP
jgi:arylsulfatase A-like enzyme